MTEKGGSDELDFRILEPEQAKQYVGYDADLSPFIRVIGQMESGRIGTIGVTGDLNSNKIKRRLAKAAEVLGKDIIIYTNVKDPNIIVFKVYDPPIK